MAAYPDVSIALAPSADIVELARVAERAGCRRVWIYDSPSLYGDVWVAVTRVAEGTDRIGVGTGVAVPSLRHPMVTASAIAMVEDLAPGRLVAAFGTGYTARRAMGLKPMSWASLATYVDQLRRLLAGEVVEIDGAAAQMIHSPGWGPARPIPTPIWTAPSGPKGLATSTELGVPGVLLATLPQEGDPPFAERGLLMNGTVLREGEDHTSPRVFEARGPWSAGMFHALWEMNPATLAGVPGGSEWLAEIEALRPEGQRHLAVHEGHITVLSDRDRRAVQALGEELLAAGWSGTAESVRARAAEAAAAGITELVFGPVGPDLPGEIERFTAAVQA